MKKILVSASLIAVVVTIGGTAAAQSTPAPAAPAPPAAPATAPPAPAYPAPSGDQAAPGYPPPSGPAPGAPLAPSPLYGPSPYGAAPGPAYVPPPQPPQRPEGTAGYVGDAMVGVAWDVGVPVGSVHDFTANVSPVGFEISLRYWLHPRFTIGGGVEWQTYRDDKPRTTYQITDGAVTATAYNSLQTGSLRVGGDFYFLDRGPVLPYLGANIGYAWSTFQSSAADLLLYDNKDSVVVGVEAGALFALAPRAPLVVLAARYNAAPALEFLNSVKDVQSVTFQLGLLIH